jgi:hypothetical protein
MKIDFTVVHPRHGKFADALHLLDDHTLTDAEIEALKHARFDKWVETIESPPLYGTMDVEGEQYIELDGLPPTGATVKEIDGVWYYKV